MQCLQQLVHWRLRLLCRGGSAKAPAPWDPAAKAYR
jgi:hypothetical protein